MVLVVPSCCDRLFHADTRLGVLGLEALVYAFELFLSSLQPIACVPILFGSVRGVFLLLKLKDGLFLLESQALNGEGFDDCSPLLPDGHLHILEIFILISVPVKDCLLIFFSGSKRDKFILKDGDSVCLLLRGLTNEVINKFKHPGVEFIAERLWGVGVD